MQVLKSQSFKRISIFRTVALLVAMNWGHFITAVTLLKCIAEYCDSAAPTEGKTHTGSKTVCVCFPCAFFFSRRLCLSVEVKSFAASHEVLLKKETSILVDSLT